MEWFDAVTNPPSEEGRYLCITLGGYFAFYQTLRYSKNLKNVDEFNFHNLERPGWYAYDGEYGYYEIDDVVRWMPLPEPPEDLKGVVAT